MDDTSSTIRQLKAALRELSPGELAAWTEWVESRLTERMQRRSAQAPKRPPEENVSDG
jgi:phytoene dehydrogenase-like protein